MSAFSAFGRPKSRSRDDHSTRSVSLDTDVADPGIVARAASSHDHGTNLEPERSRWGRAQSKSGFLGLFRGKSREPSLKQGTLLEGERMTRTSLAPPVTSNRLSSMPAIRTSTQYEDTQQRNHSSSGIEAPSLDANSLSPFAQIPNTRRASRISLDSPPLSSVYSQATKHGFVTTPAGSTETLLRAHMAKHSSHHNETEPPPLGVDADQPAMHLPADAFTTKVYVLTTAGCLLQYSGDGNGDRKPEKVMQLTSESAAMACDAIPGKHWVLHVCESFMGNEPVLNPRVSRFGFTKLGIGAKKGAENYLMIMESPDELDSWLMTIRHVIQSSGRQDFKLDRPATSSTAAGLDDDENISPRSSYAYEGTAPEAPLVRIERTASKVQRKPVGSGPSVSSLPKTTESSQMANKRPSTSDSSTVHQMNSDVESKGDYVGGKDFVARVSTESNGPEHGRGNETLQDEGQPSRTLGPGHSRGSAPSHRSQNSTESLSSQPSNSQLNRLATTGRRRSSSVQSSGTTGSLLREGFPAADHVPHRRQSPNRLSAAQSPSDSRSSHQPSITGLRKRTTVIKIDSSGSHIPQEFAQVQSPQTQAERRDRQEQEVRCSSTEQSDGLTTLAKASSIDQNLGSEAATQQHPRNSFRRLTPDPEHGPIVLTPPESPHVTEDQTNFIPATTASVIDSNNSASTIRAKAPKDDVSDDVLEASPIIQDIHSPSLSVQQLDDQLNSPLSTTTELMPGDSPAKAVAVVIPLATARPVQVDVPRSPTLSSGRSHSFASLKTRNTDSKPMSAETLAGVADPLVGASAAPGDEAGGPVDATHIQPEAEDLEKGQRTHSSSTSSVNSSVKSSASRIPPRQSSLLYGHGIFPPSVPTSIAGSAPNSGRSTPSSAHRKESVALTKTSQLRQKLAAIDTARLSHANGAHLFTPSPHPAPTGALPALPPGASKGRSPVGSRPSSRADRSRAPSATSLRNESVASSVSCRKPSGSDEQSLTPDRGHSRSGSQELTGGEIVESTRSRRPKVERVTLAPMSDVTGVAERRRNRSPSPGNYTEQENLSKVSPRPPSPPFPPPPPPPQAAPDPRIQKSTGWRSGKALSLIRESSVRSTSTLIARSERNNRTEIEQIEEDLNSHDKTLPLSEKISPDALNSELFLDLDTTSPTAREIQEAHTESQARLRGFYDEPGNEGDEMDDAFDEIPIALAVTPRTISTQPTEPLDGIPSGNVDFATGAGHDEGIAAPAMMQYPKRTSSMSQAGASQGHKVERPMLLRLATTGSLQKVDTIETSSVAELTSASPVGSLSDAPTGPLVSRTRQGGHSPPMPPPSRPPPPPPVSVSASASASSSSVTSPSDSSVASPASRTTSPSVPMSKFSPQAAHWSNVSNTAFYTRKSSEEDGSEGLETGTSAGSLAPVETKRSKQKTPPPPPPPPKSSLAALARAAAPERTPPLQMQASVTDFSQDDFFGWSMPVYSGYSGEKASRDRDELEGHENMDTPRASTYGNGNKSMPEISNSCLEQDSEPLYKPLELSGLQLSLGDSLQPEPAGNSETENKTDGTSDARDPRWSLFGAIEGIN